MIYDSFFKDLDELDRCPNPDCVRLWHGLPINGVTFKCPGSHLFDSKGRPRELAE